MPVWKSAWSVSEKNHALTLCAYTMHTHCTYASCMRMHCACTMHIHHAHAPWTCTVHKYHAYILCTMCTYTLHAHTLSTCTMHPHTLHMHCAYPPCTVHAHALCTWTMYMNRAHAPCICTMHMHRTPCMHMYHACWWAMYMHHAHTLCPIHALCTGTLHVPWTMRAHAQCLYNQDSLMSAVTLLRKPVNLVHRDINLHCIVRKFFYYHSSSFKVKYAYHYSVNEPHSSEEWVTALFIKLVDCFHLLKWASFYVNRYCFWFFFSDSVNWQWMIIVIRISFTSICLFLHR